MRQNSTILAFSTLATCSLLCQTMLGQSSKPAKTADDSVKNALQHLSQKQLFELKYKMTQGEKIRWSVEHVATTKTQIAGKLEETSSRSQSQKLWTVLSVDQLGNMTFAHSVESVKMWQKIGEQDPVAYDSKADQTPPEEYEAVAEKIGHPLATITITSTGKIVDRKSDLQQARFGVGDICVPLPEKPVSIGYKWFVPTSLTASDEDGRQHQLKTRIHYELSKVKDKKAYISFRTEVLTPIESQKVKSQIMQQMTNGYLVFDLDRGRMVRKEIEWDEKVQGYEGPDSYLQYLGHMTEQLAEQQPNVRQSKANPAAQQKIKSRTDKPVIRK